MDSYTYKRKKSLCNMDLYSDMFTVGKYDFPFVRPYNEDMPNRLLPFNKALRSRKKDSFVHFYINDYQFERLWNVPKNYLDVLKGYDGVVSPDFSVYVDMPEAMRIWNTYRNRFLASWMQMKGIDVIPNVTWSDEESYRYCFDGLPKRSIVAVNSMGIIGNRKSLYLWQKGYEKMLSLLEPIQIVRYGAKIKGEDESISRYYECEHLRRMKNGR